MTINNPFAWKCNICSVMGHGNCSSYASNLISLFYNYWLSKATVLEDPKNQLVDTFDILNLKRMNSGMVPVILNYFNDDLIFGDIVEIKTDYAGRPIGARIILTLTNLETKEVVGVHWKVKRKEAEYKAYLKKWGWSNYSIYDCIFFLNNVFWTPSLQSLNKIIYNIHDLDDINDENHKNILPILLASTTKKLTPEQLSNLSITYSCDGKIISVVDSEGISNINNDTAFKQKIQVASLSRWKEIKDEIDHFADKFVEFAGISKEKLSNQRENISETMSRYARNSAIENQYYKYIKMFINEYQEYYNVEVKVEYDTSINDVFKNTLKENFKETSEINSNDNEELEIGDKKDGE